VYIIYQLIHIHIVAVDQLVSSFDQKTLSPSKTKRHKGWSWSPPP